ncbi:PREDICTED: sodium- and chloride-dependent glycine transporter 1-like [Priapulus caudatus]|uniref:Sodium- and chloride-dependent glycine transporter 1-like n=1 Tax=Priapulus caudatus TaxID=37621 RepID=A0ABM1EDS2_PRICU|nr:PREDICTED: sodium- and chloride-dependent glycine transporter 1-like [Priapulus caudatus]
MKAELPWAKCGNEWNTGNCSANTTQTNGSDIVLTPAEEYFYNKVLNISTGIDEPGGFQVELVATLAAAWFIVFLVLIKGVGSLGKVVYFVAIFPYVVLTALLINGLLLEGAIDGIIYYITPDWNQLLDIKVWRDAAVQTFYSLSACTGGLIAMSSYSDFHNNVRRDAIAIPLISLATSIYAGLVIFTVLGFMANFKGVDISEVAEQGPGLVFVVYPEGISRMPLAPFWAIIFFFMMVTLGFGTQFSIMESVMSGIFDVYPTFFRASTWRMIAFRALFCGGSFLIGLSMVTRGGMYVLNVVDESIGGIVLIILGIVEFLTIHWVYVTIEK